MRVAAQAAIVCALLCVLGVFLPAGRLDLGGKLGASRTSRSFYQLGKSTDAVRAFLARYRASTAKHLGAKALDKLAPHLPGRLQSPTREVQDAMATLDELRDEDVRTVGTITAVTMWSLLALNLVVIALVFRTDGRTARLRVAAALVGSLLTAAIAVAVHLVLRTVVAEANAEVERTLFSLRGGAYLMPVAAVASTLAVIAWFAAYVRVRGRMAAVPATR